MQRRSKSLIMRRIFVVISIILVVAAAALITIFSSVTPPTKTATPKIKTITYYVSPAGDNTNSGKRPNKPLATIQTALKRAKPGENIQLADGIYQQSVISVRDGTKDKPITIKGSRQAVVKGSDAQSRVIEINHDHIVLDGFSINGQVGPGKAPEDFKDKLIYAIGTKPNDGVEGLKIKNMLLENAGGECVRIRYFARHNEISDSIIRNCGIYDFTFDEGGKNGEGIYIGTAPEQLGDGRNPTTDPDVSTDNWVHHNTITTHGNECVDIKEASTNNLVEHNTCSNQLDEKSGGMDARGNNNTFRYNVIRDNIGAGIRFGGDAPTDGINNNAYGNQLIRNQAGAIRVLRQPQGKVCGNTMVGNGMGIDEEARSIDPSVNCD